eukprot:4944612-Alexandrium_andersonii.AAC.1
MCIRDSPKCIYVRPTATVLRKFYLMCLLAASKSTLRPMRPVDHLRREGYYKALLGIEPSRRPHAADDAGLAALPPVPDAAF